MRIIPFLLLGVLVACGGGSDTGGGDQGPMDCAEAIMTRACAASATVNKCVTCSGLSGCHGKDSPAITGLDLSADGLVANEHGKKLINKKADDVNGLCGAAAMPPLSGKVIIDPNNPENSLMYKKVQTNFSECGLRMPYTATKALSASDQQCILDWIKKIPGVSSGASSTADGG
jgi:hypothetical protein